ncbi:hypothetical protein D3C81_1357130 [compost metagenome]
MAASWPTMSALLAVVSGKLPASSRLTCFSSSSLGPWATKSRTSARTSSMVASLSSERVCTLIMNGPATCIGVKPE